jgi:hypothetical protein
LVAQWRWLSEATVGARLCGKKEKSKTRKNEGKEAERKRKNTAQGREDKGKRKNTKPIPPPRKIRTKRWENLTGG